MRNRLRKYFARRFNISSPVPSGLIAKLIAERRPAGVEHGLCHPRLDQLDRVHIADGDQTVRSSNTRRLLVEMVAPGVGDLGVDRGNAAPVSGAARLGERGFVSAVMPQRRHHAAIAACGKLLEAKVDADLTGTGRQPVGHLALKGDIPAAARVLHKTAGLDLAADLARQPDVKSALQIGDAAAVDLDGALDKRHPAQALLDRAPARTTPDRITACGKVTADGLNRVRVQAEFLASASAELHQVKGRGPLTLPFHGVALRPATMVPDEVASTRVAQQMPSGRGVLDAVFVGEDHALA